MVARTHDIIAFASLMTVAALQPPGTLTVPTLMTCIIGNVVGSLTPDLDQASNRLWDMLPAGNLMGRIFRRVFLRHRTISHSLIGAYLYYRLLEWGLPKLFNPSYVDTHVLLMSIMIGFISHLVADAMTKEGIPLLFPSPLKFGFPPLRLFRITTDSWVEHWVVLPVVIMYIFWFIGNFQHELTHLIRLVKEVS